MSTTRDLVLKTLLNQPRSTINEIAEKVGISPISVRHHISSLEVEGFISCEDERHGIGRPHQVFFLTEKGMEQFPTRYVSLTVRLLEHLKETMPEAMISKLFTQMAIDLAKDLSNGTETRNLGMHERLNLVKELLLREGSTSNGNSLKMGTHPRGKLPVLFRRPEPS
jgi:predicted ArsR family transcriptional regulator